MKPFTYYSETKLSYPHKNNFTRCYLYNKGKVVWEGTFEQYTSPTLDVENIKGYPLCAVQKVFDKDGYKKALKEYQQELNLLCEEFKRDLFEDYGVSDNPKREKCFTFAWEHSHSAGLQEVYEYFGDLVQLIKD